MQRTTFVLAIVGIASWSSTVKALGPSPNEAPAPAPSPETAKETPSTVPTEPASAPAEDPPVQTVRETPATPEDPDGMKAVGAAPDEAAAENPAQAADIESDPGQIESAAQASPEEQPAAAQPAAEQPAEALCPCDELDWQCIQDHPGCEPEPAPPPARPREVERAPITEPDPEPNYEREGVFVGLSVGIGSCGQQDCSSFAVGGVGGADFGYRFGVAELFTTVQGGGGPMNVSPLEGSVTFVDVGAGLRIFPVKLGRVDPYIGASLGWTRFAFEERFDGDDFEVHSSRGAFRPGAGLLVYVTEKVSLGPRFDVSFPFAGELCSSVNDGSKECIDVADLVEQESENDFQERSYRRSFARMWALTFFVTRTF